MSTTSISFKHNNHRIHPCRSEKKLELLNLLISQNNGLTTVIVSSNNLDIIKDALDDKSILVKNDEEIMKTPEVTYELLISYDLPLTGIEYLARVAHATEKALILLDSHEQNALYPIETLLGRTIKQEIISGFEPEVIIEKKTAFTKSTKSQAKAEGQREFKSRDDKREFKPRSDKKEYKPREDKKEFKPRDDKKEYKPREDKKEFKPKFEKSDRKPYDKDKKDEKKSSYSKDFKKSESWDKKDKKKNQFLGKDENGKALFSGKSGDRNHRHDGTKKEQIDAPKKTGRTINIKALNEKKEEK